jgi:hypothetical protein
MSSLRFLIILLVLATNYFSRITTDAASSLPTLSKRRMNLNGVHLKFGAIHVSWSSKFAYSCYAAQLSRSYSD